MAVNDDEYKNMDDEDKTEYLSNLRKSVEEAVKMKQFGHTPTKKLNKYTNYILKNYAELTAD